MKTNDNIKKLVIAAMFAALTTVATMIIRIPTIGTSGYVNIGDTIVLLASWLLGNPYGALAAGIGSGLADLLAGYGSYVPGTTIIKFAMAFVSAIIYKKMPGKGLKNILALTVSGIVAEIIMIGGYFLYESTLLGYGPAAVPSIGSNAIQGITCLVLGVLLAGALSQSKALARQLGRD